MFRRNHRRNQRNLIRQRPLGEILIEAGLLSHSQIEVALMDQTYNSGLLLGEILALRGWVKQDTADFFVRDWPSILSHRSSKPIGHYFKRAGLLSEAQIRAILKEHKQTGVRFGTVAVLQGLLNERTLDFFLTSLSPQERKQSPFKTRHLTSTSRRQTKSPTKNTLYSIDMSELESFFEEDSFISDNLDLASSLPGYKKNIDEVEDSVIWVG